MNIAIVTGVAGFIGYHMAKLLVQDNWFVYGIDKEGLDYDRKDLYN